MTDQLPADIAEAVRRVVETQRAFALMDHHPSNWQAAKASVECSDALSALDAVILKHLGSEWRPISTLPDGTTHALISDGHTVGEGFWHDGKGCHRAGPGWFWEMDRGDLLTAKNAYATHWRPMPEPPTDLGRSALAEEGGGR